MLDAPCTKLYRKLMHIAESIVPCHTHIINYDDKNTKKRKHKKSSASFNNIYTFNERYGETCHLNSLGLIIFWTERSESNEYCDDVKLII